MTLSVYLFALPNHRHLREWQRDHKKSRRRGKARRKPNPALLHHHHIALLDSIKSAALAPQKNMASRHHYQYHQRQQPQEGFNTEAFTERVLVRDLLVLPHACVCLL